jgi:glycine cleavage system regulatory protein
LQSFPREFENKDMAAICWYHKQKKLMRNLLLTSSNMAAMTSHANGEFLVLFLIGKQKRGLKRHFTAHFDRDNVAVRQLTLTNTYNKLLESSQVKTANKYLNNPATTQDSVLGFHSFLRE